MKKGKKLLALLAGLALSTTAVMGFAACGDDDKGPVGDYDMTGIAGTYDITVWNSEITGVSDLTKAQIARFNSTNEYGITINATVEAVKEGEAATDMITDVETGADMYFFAQDQTMRLVQAGALTKLGNKSAETIKSRNDSASVSAATVGSDLYCYPATSDNGYFMYYNKSIIKEEHIDSLEDIIADCEAAGYNFSFELEESGWYNASFFFATGCRSSWTTDNDGKFVSVTDDFNSDKGVIALRGMQKVLKSKAYVNSSSVTTLDAAIPSAVLVSGTWASTDAKKKLGDDYGVADLPSFTVDGKSYHLGSFSGSKLLGIKPQTDNKKAAVLQQLALYLTNDECQLERFNQFGWGPSNVTAQQNDAVKADAAIVALAQQNNYAIVQGQIANGWWSLAQTYAASAAQAEQDNVEELKGILATYAESLSGLTKVEENLPWSVIGSIYGDSWKKDIPMVDKSGVWYSAPILFEGGEQFKVRQGDWVKDSGTVIEGAVGYETIAEGDGAGNAKVTTGGLYIVKYTDAGIELIPVTLGVVGSITNWADGQDKAMTKVDGEIAYISEALELAANAELKVRPNGSWAMGDIGNAEGENVKVTEVCTKKVKVAWDSTNYTWVLSLVD